MDIESIYVEIIRKEHDFYMNILRNTKIRLIIIFICIVVIIYESVCLYKDNKEYAVAETEYETLVNETVQIIPTPEATEKESYPQLVINTSQLKSINEDYVAWLYFPYFNINYPVVQETEVDEYLKKTFDGTKNSSGCLFTDILSSPDFTGMHDIIFGHNMRNGSMFGKLKQLVRSDNRDLIKENPYIYVYTEKNVYKYLVFAYYVTTVGSDAYSVITNDEEYDTFLKYINTNSVYNKPEDLDLSYHPSILTLSTCSGRSGSGRRFVIHAAKVSSWNL